MYLTLVEYYPSRMDSATPSALLAPPHFPMNFNRKMGEAGWGLRQFLFDRQFDSFHAAVDAEFVEDVRDVEFDRTEAHHQRFGDLIVVESIGHAFEDIAFAPGQLFAMDLRLRN